MGKIETPELKSIFYILLWRAWFQISTSTPPLTDPHVTELEIANHHGQTFESEMSSNISWILPRINGTKLRQYKIGKYKLNLRKCLVATSDFKPA